MVESLHHNSTVRQHHGTSVDKRFIRYTIPLVIALYVTDLIILNHKAADAITGTYPDIMEIIFHNAVDDIVQKSLITGKELRQMSRLVPIELQSCGGTDPVPSA